MIGTVTGEDGRSRCSWGDGPPIYRCYHDQEWGVVLHGRDALFERLSLEAFQAGLSWLTVLRKRDRFRAVFAGFDAGVVAEFGPADVEALLTDAGIVRNAAKIEATINNARLVVELDDFDALVWSFAPRGPRPNPVGVVDVLAWTPESTALAAELRRRGFRFVGPRTAHSLMQATGMVDDHLQRCWRAGR